MKSRNSWVSGVWIIWSFFTLTIFGAPAVATANAIEPAVAHEKPLLAAYTATSTPAPAFTPLATLTAACLPNTPLSAAYLPNSSYVNEILAFPDGSFLLRGRMDGSEGTWLAKMDTAGKLLWQNVYGTRMGKIHLAASGNNASGNIVLEFDKTNVEIAPDGKIVRALPVPWYQPNPDGGFTIIADQRVTRYKDLQTPLWQVGVKDFGGLITSTSDGGAVFAYAGGYTDRSVYYAPQYTDIKVIKITPDGQAIQRVYGKLVGDETLDFLLNTGDGGALLAGTHAYEQLAEDYDIWLMKVNGGGGLSWQTTLKLPPYGETLQGLYLLKSGYLAVVSTVESNDPVLLRLSPNGSLIWQKLITSSRGMVEVSAAASTADGGLMLAGKTWEKASVYWLAKLDSRGRLVWEKTLGFELPGAPGSEAMTILPLANKQILLGGLTNQLGSSLAPEFSAWIAQVPDTGQALGLINLLPGKFSAISALGSRPNTLPDEILAGAGTPLKGILFPVLETKLQPVPACLPAGAVFPTPAALPSLTPSVTPTQVFTRNLYLTDPPMKGDDVLKLQQRLFELGYTEVGARDGIFGRMTAAAVRNFQQRNDLEIDGYVGPKTWARLFSKDAVRA
jgi:hypothetical protein